MTKQRTVVITGASAGVGRAAAREFARRGDYVVLLARDQARLHDTEQELIRLGARALALSVDVADADAVERAAEHIERTVGPIDVWVNNAMVTIVAPFHQISPAEFKRVTEVTYLGVVYGTMSALKRMRERNAGSIIQVGSTLAYRAIPLQSAYCGAKHAIRGFTDSLRSELLHDGIRVALSMVQLPGLNTPQFEWSRNTFARHHQPVGPVYQPEVAARAIVWAAEHRRREIHVGWPALVTIAVNKIMPGWLDRYLARNAYEQQFTGQPVAPERPDNLFHPAPTPYRVHGIFDARAHPSSLALWLTLHREVVAIGVAALAIAATMALYIGIG